MSLQDPGEINRQELSGVVYCQSTLPGSPPIEIARSQTISVPADWAEGEFGSVATEHVVRLSWLVAAAQRRYWVSFEDSVNNGYCTHISGMRTQRREGSVTTNERGEIVGTED